MILRQSKRDKQPGCTYHRCQLSYAILLLLCNIGLTACQNQSVETARINAAVKKAIEYLHQEYNPTLGLMRESPETAPDKHWLLTDNWLAATALKSVGDKEFADKLHVQLADYATASHGLIEAIVGSDITWPPQTPSQREIAPEVWVEVRNGNRMEDWQSYSDLALYQVLDLYNEGRIVESRHQYEAAIKQFDDIGFVDQAFDGRYTTYKLALAIYVGCTIHAPIKPDLMTALLSKQLSSGGFSALYDETGNPIGDSNTETTAYALLALSMLQHE